MSEMGLAKNAGLALLAKNSSQPDDESTTFKRGFLGRNAGVNAR